jgi:tetratricopeptide (TPR) repeat protein
LKHISKTPLSRRVILIVSVFLAAGCALQKETAVNRGLQNLTAHYNILFNANEILRQKQEAYAVSFVDSYNEILNVYQDTTAQSSTPDQELAEAKAKANKIINIKEQSHYIGDAYLVLGKASFLGGDYFSALEYFNYVTRSFADKPMLVQQALFWKARSLMYLNQMPKAKLVIDTAVQTINPKKKAYLADIYATKLQYDINVEDYADAEQAAQQAIHYCHAKAQRLRWTFILAQLQELNHKNAEAIKNYTHVANSNASFEMAFNANLNRIRLEEVASGVKLNRIDRLRALIKNENNKDFIDQVYYQIAELYFINNDIDNAVKNYQLSVRNSRSNQNQKGLSYLRLADIDFKNKADYIGAKRYYDSTLMSLSPNYPGYQSVEKKRDNLQVLADKYGIIAREDTLQMLAGLDEKTRGTKIDAMVQKHTLQLQAESAAPLQSQTSAASSPGASGNSSFYFYNSNALSQGMNDFKRKWGNRKLEDNWRRSNKGIAPGSALGATQNTDPDAPSDPFAAANDRKAPVPAGNYRQQLIKDLPLTAQLLAQSNQRIYNAYFDIANFYRDVLGDKKEAIAAYQSLRARFPGSNDKAAIYYSLYRLYTDLPDIAKADEYKNLVLKNYPQTAFAKTIIDPEYGKRVTDADAGLNGMYNNIYDLYSKKKFKEAIKGIDSLSGVYPNNKLSSQLAYLRAISSGHLERLAPFRQELTEIVSKYPNDQLITPLVRQHLAYIDTHMAEMATYPVALIDNDTNDVPFKQEPTVEDKIAAYNNSQLVRQVAQQRIEPKAQKKPDSTALKAPVTAPAEGKPVTAAANPAANHPPVAAAVKPKPKPSIFSMSDSTNYYFVVNVSTATINLASSRFGIGQFNRTNYQQGTISHQLKDVGEDNQLIYVGRFYSLDDVKAYARAIIPLMPDIMKVPKDQYSFFIITKQNLDKLNNKKLLDSYIEYYQSNY